MPQMNNNDTTTLLLLLALGILIWFLTRPNKNGECFTDYKNYAEVISNKVASNGVASNGVASNGVASNGVASNGVASNGVASNPMVQQALINGMQQAVSNGVVSNGVASNPMVQQAVLNSVMQQVPSTDMIQQGVMNNVAPQVMQQVAQVASGVSNYSGYDESSLGAELAGAYQLSVPAQNSLSIVDINKQNLQDYNAKDFLPKEINDQWFDTDFSQAKTNINDDKLINTERYVIGINTVGQSLKNASYDIRGTIANPKFSVSPWNNSTYEPDYNIKPLC